MPSIIYPTNCTTNIDRLEFLYSLQEKMRVEFNSTGSRYRSGRMSFDEWSSFKKDFTRRNYAVSIQIASIRDGVVKGMLGMSAGDVLDSVKRAIEINQIKSSLMSSTRWAINTKSAVE